MRQEVYNFKLNGVLRERMTVDAKQPIVTLEMFAHDGKLMHTEKAIEAYDGKIMRFRVRKDKDQSWDDLRRALERGDASR